jgi:phosphohistidine phosphatase
VIVYLMRHGQAARAGPDQPTSLTPQGRSDVERMARHLADRRITADILWRSPKTRAVQTAEILLEFLATPRTIVQEKEDLSPNGDYQNIFRELMVRKVPHFLSSATFPRSVTWPPSFWKVSSTHLL